MKLTKVLILIFILIGYSNASHLKIAIISDEYNEKLSKKIELETNQLFSYEEQIVFEKYNISNKNEFDEITRKLDKNQKINMILAIGDKSSNYLIKKDSFKKPSIAIGFLNNSDKLIKNKNLSIIDYSTYKKDLEFIKENFPTAKIARVSADFINNKKENWVGLSSKPYLLDYDFVYISSLNGISKKEKENLFKYTNDNKIKSFFEGDSSDFINKALFSNVKKEFTKISRAVALQVHQVLIENEKLENLIKIYSNNQVVLNENTANKIEFFPTFKLLSQVIQKDEVYFKNRSLNLEESFQLVLKNSYDYKIAKNTLMLKNEDINSAYSSYRSDIYASTSYYQIDKDRALYSNGVSSQKTLKAGLTLTQLIYSNSASKTIDIQKLLFKSQKNETQTVKQAILYNVVSTYLNVLNTQKSYEIVKSKVDFIKQNLRLAKNRLEVGASDKSDIYRWQNELANANIDLVATKQAFNSLKIELSNLLQIPNKQNISLKQYSVSSDIFKLFGKTPATLISKPTELEKIAKFLSNNLIVSHKTINMYEELIKAKREELNMNKNDRFSPTISFSANVSETLHRAGSGADVSRAWNDTEYQVGISVNLPLYESGKKSISIEKSRIELINLQHNLQNEKSKIQKNIFQTMQNISASFNSIKFSSIAYESSLKNYELIQDKYSKGEASIVTLLDAQNSMIISNIQKNSSVYNYLVDVSTIFYNTGFIEVLNDKNKKDEMQNKLNEVL